jgi:lysophospholipid acyltransferase (LPLAT)-like uncharacterized protein
MAVKATLYNAMRRTSLSQIELAKRLNSDEKEISCLLDPHQDSKLSHIEKALQTIGYQLVVGSMPGLKNQRKA